MNSDKEKAILSLKTCKGQVEGILKMIDDDRYCIDISNQIIAAQSLLKKANMLILKQHITHCVKDALKNGDGEGKVDEVMDVISKIINK